MYIEVEQAIVPRLCKRCCNIIPVRGLCINIAGQIQNRPIKVDVCSKCVDELKFTIDNWSIRSEES
ncbi:MAG: hypothetical protein A2Y12_03675 [Planctomycetes bacterium GWF2_42_9]|nr:MAG: hypothetical protein A2Y12_03675 [Planctomycetes bacterium GWF2_42_9]